MKYDIVVVDTYNHTSKYKVVVEEDKTTVLDITDNVPKSDDVSLTLRDVDYQVIVDDGYVISPLTEEQLLTALLARAINRNEQITVNVDVIKNKLIINKGDV